MDRQKRIEVPRIVGQRGETLAAEELMRCGYSIREKNFRCRHGEIDLIAEHDQDLVFIEVKTRRGTARGLPEEAVDRRKQRQLIKVAMFYIQVYVGIECAWRIDVVAVQMSRDGKLEEVRIYPHAVFDVP